METPELDKMAKIRPQSQVIGEFLDWACAKKGLTLCRLSETTDRFHATRDSKEQLLAEFFEIDLDKVEKERRELLARVSTYGRPKT